MRKTNGVRYNIDLSFEEIKLPPVQDILVLGKNSHYGKIGILKSFELLVPNGFEVVEVTTHDNVDAVLVSKRILNKISKEKILEILKDKVFAVVSEGEVLKVDFKVTISYSNVKIEP